MYPIHVFFALCGTLFHVFVLMSHIVIYMLTQMHIAFTAFQEKGVITGIM